jgi:hypothetical protein
MSESQVVLEVPFEAAVVAFVGTPSRHQALMEAWDRNTGLSSAKADIRAALMAAQGYIGEDAPEGLLIWVAALSLDSGASDLALNVGAILDFGENPAELVTLLVAIQEALAYAFIAEEKTKALVREWTAQDREDDVTAILERARGVAELPAAIGDAVNRIAYPEAGSSLRDEVAPILVALNGGETETTDATATLAQLLVEALEAEEGYPFGNPLDIDFQWFEKLEEVTTPPSGDVEASPDTIAPAPWVVVVDLPDEATEGSRLGTAFQTARALCQDIEVVFTRSLPPLIDDGGDDLWDPLLITIGKKDRVALFADKDESALWEELTFELLAR